MSQTSQQGQGAAAAKPKARKDWEWFWRIIAGLMLIVIAWVIWVLYQITPRSVVTPLAYESRTKSIAIPQAAPGVNVNDAAAPKTESTSAVQAVAPGTAPVQPAAVADAAGQAMDLAQTAARAGAHQSSADVQAAALEKARAEDQAKRNGLKLSTEIGTPPSGK
jgi:cytoskeletal protein RodZ